jgi:hypothetical protein
VRGEEDEGKEDAMTESLSGMADCSHCDKAQKIYSMWLNPEVPGLFCSSECSEAKRTPQPFLPARGQRVRVVEIHPRDGGPGCSVGEVIDVGYASPASGPGFQGWVVVSHGAGMTICRVAPVEEAKWEPREGEMCEGEWKGETRRGAFVGFRWHPGTDAPNPDGLYAALTMSSGYDMCVDRSTLRPVDVTAPTVATDADIRDACEVVRAKLYCPCGQLAKAGGQCADCRSDTENGRTSLPQLSEPGALAARRMRSAKEQMVAPLKKARFVPEYPRELEWPMGDDDV